MSDITQLVPNCIEANPDIAGIGVRFATYFQNFMVLLLAFLALSDGYITHLELDIVKAYATSILLAACALLISAFVHATRFGMSTYHAIIILNLAWMNNTSTYIYMTLFEHCYVFDPFTHQLPFILGSLHLSLLAGFGLWFWATVDTFGAAGQCELGLPIPLSILGFEVAVTNQALRIASLAIYTTIAVPGLNVVVLDRILSACASFLASALDTRLKWLKSHMPQKVSLFRVGSLMLQLVRLALFGRVSLALLFFINYAIMVDTQVTIGWASPFVKPGELDWTFGQTLAALLISAPVLEVFRSIVRGGKSKMDDRSLKLLPPSDAFRD